MSKLGVLIQLNRETSSKSNLKGFSSFLGGSRCINGGNGGRRKLFARVMEERLGYYVLEMGG